MTLYRTLSVSLILCIAATAVRADDAKPTAKTAGTAAAIDAGRSGDWLMWGGKPDRNMVSLEKNIPAKWDVKKGTNIKWATGLGSQTYGNPVVTNGKVIVGTNNNGHLRPGIDGDKGVVVCLDEKTGKLLWQATHDKLPTGRVNDWPEQGICSTAYVSDGKIYYVSNRAEVVCVDPEGMHNGNDGPYKNEQYKDVMDADFIWTYDMIDELDAFPHNLATCSPVGWKDYLFISTSNGVDEGHLVIPEPDAPDFICLDKNTGKLLWDKNYTKGKVLHGQWSSPACGVIGGREQVIFGAGDGWIYSLDMKTGDMIWKFDMNPKDSKWVLGGRGTRNAIIATPVIHDDSVFLCVGQDPEHGEGIGHLYRIDATKTGDVTESGRIWQVGGEDFKRSMSTVSIVDDLLYASDLSGFLYCMDAKTGKKYWSHDTFAAIWGSPYYVDGKIMLGTEDGEVLVFENSRTKKQIATNDMLNSVYTTPVVANGTLYITNRNKLFAIQATASDAPKKAEAPAPKMQ